MTAGVENRRVDTFRVSVGSLLSGLRGRSIFCLRKLSSFVSLDSIGSREGDRKHFVDAREYDALGEE